MLDNNQAALLDGIILKLTGEPPPVAIEPMAMLVHDLGLCPFDDYAQIVHEVQEAFAVEIPIEAGNRHAHLTVGALRDMLAAELAHGA